MSWRAKTAALALIPLSYVGISGAMVEFITLPLLGLAGLVIWRELEGFWPALFGGMVGGAVAGLLILGPGFRLAMRAVAIMDAAHPEEFTLEGTLFIVVGIGAIMGGITAMVFQVARRVFRVGSAIVAGSALALTEMVVLTFFSGELSTELSDLGLGIWVNLPLFGLVTLGFGIAAMALADRAEAVMFPHRRNAREKVAA